MEHVRLKDVCTLINGRAYKQEELLSNGKYPVLRVGNFFSDKDFYYSDLELDEDKYCDNGDLLFAWSASFGPKIWTGEKVIYHYHIWKMVLSDIVDKEYLYYYLLYLSERIKAEGHGGIMIHTTKVEMEEREILLPSLEQQKELVRILNRMQTIIQNRKLEVQKLDDLIKARFVELFGDLMENPFGWPVKTIADVSTFLKSGLSRKLSDNDIGLPVIRSGNIQDGQFIFDDVKYWYADDPQGANTKDYILNDGDVLVNFINSSSQIGKTAIYRDTGRDCIYTTNLFRMKLADNCDEYYYNWFAMSEYYYRHLQNIIQPAVNQSSFTTVNFLKLPIPLPSKERQVEFSDFVKQVDKSKIAIQESLDETQLLFDSLMQKYFG